MTKVTGEGLNAKWGIGAAQARYRQTGDFYMSLERFPGAFCDAHGCVLFRSEWEYVNSKDLKFYITKAGPRVNVPKCIASIPGYIRVMP